MKPLLARIRVTGRRVAACACRASLACLIALFGCHAALAQTARAAPAAATPAAVAQDAQLQEVVVTGSRIAAPNHKSTSPIEVLSSASIRTTGKSDISDVLNQLPQNFNNAIGQDLGNGTSGLSTPGGVATADLRGLGPNRTLVLVDDRRLGQGSPNTAIASPAPDLDQIPLGLVDRVEVVTGPPVAPFRARRRSGNACKMDFL